MSTTQTETPTLQQFLDTIRILQENNFADVSDATVQHVLTYAHRRGYYTTKLFEAQRGTLKEADRPIVIDELSRQATAIRVQKVSAIYCGDPLLQARLTRLLLNAEQAGLRFTATDTPLKNYELQCLCGELGIPDAEKATVSDLLGALLTPSALALLQPRAANDYWRLRIVLAATTENQYYWRAFPVTKSQLHMGLHHARLTLKAPWKARCAADRDLKPTLLERITTGAALFAAADDETLVPNPLLLDDPDRNFVSKSSGHGSSYRFEGGDGFTPPAGPYQTEAEADADGDAWAGYADTIGGSAITYDVRNWVVQQHKQ